MLRYRHLAQQGNRYELMTKFVASPQEISEGSVYDLISACIVTFDFTRKCTAIDVSRWRILPKGQQAPLPDLHLIQEEVEYMFNLFKSLSPYETSQTQSQDFPQVPDQPRRDPFLEDEIPF